MNPSWFIVADDLTGAADCAIAFAKSGMPSSVLFEGGEAADVPGGVVAVDVASRALSAAQAAKAHVCLLEKRFVRPMRLYKKLDSLMRGQPMAETAATIEVLRKLGGPAFLIMAPAFPATGRTTVNGRVLVNGEPLEATEVWARDHAYPNGNLVENLGAVGVKTYGITLDVVRSGADKIMTLVRDCMDKGFDGVVCDAQTPDDLAIIAEATYPLADRVFFAGTGGLAVPLARMSAPGRGGVTISVPATERGILMVVGSLVKVSRQALRFVLDTKPALHVPFTPAELATASDAALEERGQVIREALLAGRDVVAEIVEVDDPDLSKGGGLASRLAAALHGVLEASGGLVATGGETAAMLMARAGIHGIQLVTEVESGVPVGLTLGRHALPVITKAGSFGSEHTLARCLEYIRAANYQGELA